MTFPDGFLWGVAAAAYQVEGATSQDGRGPSVWDEFCARPGAVFDGHSGESACDHYHRYPEDIALIADLGANAYRLSISWPRVMARGVGPINEAGLDFYDRVIDALMSRGVTPWVTLFHWDLPSALFHRGGWLNRASVDWFGEYAEAIARRLGDRVQHWMTFNEPQIFLGLGHSTGEHAPGLRYSRPDVLRAAHHVLLAHGRAVERIREHAEVKPIIGWAPHGCICYPTQDREEDVAAARASMFGVPDGDGWCFSTAWFADPVVLGQYPEEGLRRFGTEMPPGFQEDLEQIAQPLEFFGVNVYQGRPIAAGEDGLPVERPRQPGFPHTMCHWPVEPKVLYWGPRFLQERYDLPIYVTENGCACMDWVHQDNHVHDAPRIDYLARHLSALRQAIRDGADVRGYFQWSILDNFEWAEGYRMRFGLIYVDFETMERIPKDSYAWYQQVILSNGGCLPEAPALLR
ncbi:MAG: beta-glucosidase [bacterium]|nr:beta-glucosidase [bacterium]